MMRAMDGWFHHPHLWILLTIEGVAAAVLLLLLARLIYRRRSLESATFAMKCRRFVVALRQVGAVLWSGGWRGAVLMLVAGSIVAAFRLTINVPTYFVLESGEAFLSPIGLLLLEVLEERRVLWDTWSRLLVIAAAVPDILLAGLMVGALARVALVRTCRAQMWYRLALAFFIVGYYALLCPHHPWKPVPYEERHAWVTHSNVLFSVRVPATWRIVMASNTVDDAWMRFQSPNGTNVAVFSASALARGPWFRYCLCAPAGAYAYARSGDTHKWVLEDEFGQGLKISSPRFVGGVHDIGYQRSGLTPGALNHLLDSFRFLDPPAEPRP